MKIFLIAALAISMFSCSTENDPKPASEERICVQITNKATKKLVYYCSTMADWNSGKFVNDGYKTYYENPSYTKVSDCSTCK